MIAILPISLSTFKVIHIDINFSFQMEFDTMDHDTPIKQELIEESDMKTEQIQSIPWLVENAEMYLKYCCPECLFITKDLQDFSRHFSENHVTKNSIENSHSSKSNQNTSYNDFIKSESGNCVVPHCDTLKSFGFFKFPQKQERYDLWLQLCGLETVQEEDKICAYHFLRSDFCLKKSAYPSLNLNIGNRNDKQFRMKGKFKNNNSDP